MIGSSYQIVYDILAVLSTRCRHLHLVGYDSAIFGTGVNLLLDMSIYSVGVDSLVFAVLILTAKRWDRVLAIPVGLLYSICHYLRSRSPFSKAIEFLLCGSILA